MMASTKSFIIANTLIAGGGAIGVGLLTGHWVAIAIGLAIGTAAHWALALQDNIPVTKRAVIINALLIGMMALFASWVVQRLAVSGEAAAVIAALFALSPHHITRALRLWTNRKADSINKDHI